MQALGQVVSTPYPPNTESFWFVVRSAVNKNQFVKVGSLVARIVDIVNENDIYKNVQTISQLVKKESEIKRFVNDEFYSLTLAEAEILADVDKRRSVVPPKPGDIVEEIEPEILQRFLGLSEGEINIGKLSFHELDVKLNVDRLIKKHVAILAMSGAGKSHLASVIIEELLKLEKKPLIVVFDVHGEYVSFSKSANFAKDTVVLNANEIKIPVWNLSWYDFKTFLPELTGTQIRELKPIIAELKQSKKTFDLEDIIEEVENRKMHAKTQEALISWLMNLQRFESLTKEEYPTISFLNNYGLVVFDLSEILDVQEKQIIVSYFMSRIFAARRRKIVKPAVFFLEEAHQFVPQREEAELAIAKPIIEKIAREGRKFNTSIVLISQRPVNLSTTALSQCNTQIIMRISNPNDLDQISRSAEKLSKQFLRMLPSLRVGEAIISGEAVDYPILVRIRNRESVYEEKWMGFKQELESFTANEDIEAFL